MAIHSARMSFNEDADREKVGVRCRVPIGPIVGHYSRCTRSSSSRPWARLSMSSKRTARTHRQGVTSRPTPLTSVTGPNFVQALVRWGGALLELAHYKQGSESVDMIQLVSG